MEFTHILYPAEQEYTTVLRVRSCACSFDARFDVQ
uniref:Uncharacterized protein n=1 Tax=Anguilla anguilla TaxID=7936 RepID=A0A0E9VPJ8_ANGAN